MGLAIHQGAQIWQAKAAKIAAARPQESVITEGHARVTNIATQASVTLGKEHRQSLKEFFGATVAKDRSLVATDSWATQHPDLTGLSEAFAKDAARGQNISLVGSGGGSATKLGKRTQQPGTEFRGFFLAEFPADPSRAAKWVDLAARYTNQSAANALTDVVADAFGGRAINGNEMQYQFKLVMEPGGDAALLEVTASDTINSIVQRNEPPSRDAFLVDLVDFESKNSSVNYSMLVKIKLDGPDHLDVIAASASYRFTPGVKQPEG